MLICIQICSKREWASFKKILHVDESLIKNSPFGEYVERNVLDRECIFYYSGATVTKASASCQFAIDNWKPGLIIVLGTCGGIADNINVFDVIIANKTIYFNSISSIYCENNFIYTPFTTLIDNSWINLDKMPLKLNEGILATNDHFNNLEAASELKKENVLAIDWESSSIAHISTLNKVKCCIIRGVSDLGLKLNDELLIDEEYKRNTPGVMEILLMKILPILLQNIK